MKKIVKGHLPFAFELCVVLKDLHGALLEVLHAGVEGLGAEVEVAEGGADLLYLGVVVV